MKAALFLILCLSGVTYAEVYKWTDENGKVHYGDRPDSGQATKIKIKPSPSPNGPSRETRANQKAINDWLKARDVDREENKKKEAVLKEEKAVQKQKCDNLKKELADLEKGGVTWYDLDDTGKRHYYSDKEIKLEIESMRKTIKRHCR